MALRLDTLYYELEARTAGFDRDIAKTQAGLAKFATFIKANPVVALASLGTVIAGVAVEAVRMAEEVEKGMRRVAASVPTGTAGLDALRGTVKALSIEFVTSQQELSRVAAQIAMGGAESAAAVGERLKAVTLAARATGADLGTLAGGLDQVLELFGRASDESSEIVAKIAQAARGGATMDQMFAAFQAAAPAVNKFNLSLDDTLRALASLGSRGLSARQAGSYLAEMATKGEDGLKVIRDLAAETPTATDALRQLQERAKLVGDNVFDAATRIRMEFNAALIDLGLKILPPLTTALEALVWTFDKMGKSVGVVAGAIALLQGNAKGLDQIRAMFREDFGAVQGGATTTARWRPFGPPKPAPKPLVDPGTLQTPEQKAAEAKRQRDAAKRAAEEQADAVATLTENVRQLGEAQKNANDPIAQAADRYDDLLATLDRAAAKFPKAIEAWNDLRTSVTEMRKAAVETAKADLGAQLAKQVAALSATALDDYLLDVERMNKLTEEAINTTENLTDAEREQRRAQLAAIKAGQASAAALIKETEHIETVMQRLDALTADGFISAEDIRLSVAELDKLEARETAALDQFAIGSKDREAAEKNLLAIQQKRRELWAKLTAENPFAIEADAARETAEAQQAALLRAQRMVDTVRSAASAAISLASAFGAVSDETARTLEHVTGLGVGIAQIFTGNKAAGGLQVASSLTSLVASAIGGPAAAREQRRRTDFENAQAIADLERTVGDLARLSSLTGREIGAMTEFVTAVVGRAGEAGAHRKVGDVNVLAAQFGISGDELKSFAASLGVTIDGTVGSFRRLQEAIKALDLAALGEGFRGQLRMLETLEQASGETVEPLDALVARLKLLAGPEGAPAFARALKGLDVTTEAGRAEALRRLMDLLTNIATIDVKDLGGLEVDEFVQQMLDTIGRLRDLGPPTALEAFADAFALLSERFEVEGASAATRVADLAQLFAATFDELAFLATGDTPPAIEVLRDRFRMFFAEAASDSEITDAENAILDAFRAMLAAMEDAARESAAEQERLAQEAAEEAARAADERARVGDLRVRELRARGEDAAAEALARQLANEAELAAARLEGVSDATLAQIELVHALEASADAAARDAAAQLEAQRQAEAAAKAAADALREQQRIADAQRAAEDDLRVRQLRASGADEAADAVERQIAAERELAALRTAGVSEATIAQYALVQALEEAARAAALATQRDRDRTATARDIHVQLLRMAGENVAASALELEVKQQERRARAEALGLDRETMRRLDELEKRERAALAQPFGTATQSIGGTITLTETSGARLLDTALTANIHLVAIRARLDAIYAAIIGTRGVGAPLYPTAGAAPGMTINAPITVQVDGATFGGVSPFQVGQEVGQGIGAEIQAIDQGLGARQLLNQRTLGVAEVS